MKKLISLCMILFIMIGAGGCMRTKETTTDKLLNYINSKYDDTFHFKSVFGGAAGSNMNKILVNSEKYPDQDICVYCAETETGVEFGDNYLAVKYYQQTLSYLQETFQQVLGEKVHINYLMSNYANTEGGSDDTTLEEFLSTPTSAILVEVFACASADNRDQVEQQLLAALGSTALSATCYFAEENVDITDSQIRKKLVIDKTYTDKVYFSKDDSNGFATIEWG